jgi:hypothetical protein
MNLEERTILRFFAANSENPSYRARAGRNLTPDTDTCPEIFQPLTLNPACRDEAVEAKAGTSEP